MVMCKFNLRKLIILLALVMFLGAQNCVFANEQENSTTPAITVSEETSVDTANNETAQTDFKIDSKIQKELQKSIQAVYGEEQAGEIYDNLIKHAQTAIQNRPQNLKEQDKTRNSEWYKNEIIYMFYVDRFGVVKPEDNNTFQDSTQMFDYLQDLGVTTLYLLPFADSPMSDAGFDVKNPRDVRKDLGGLDEFKAFIKEAKARGFKIKADLVLNHLSDQHEWFQKLLKGDEQYLDYFVVKDYIPEYKRYNDEKLGTVIEYTEPDGTVSKRRLIFPENTENHFRKITVNGKDYYIYHTFYPFQPDINWENPKVLYYMLDTITSWANMSVDIFRMDAIPYLIKDAGTNGENQPKTHAVINILSDYIQLTSPSSVIQVEACQHPKDIIPYFGKDRNIDIDINGEDLKLKRTSEAQIAYNFPNMNAIWASLVTEDKKYFTDNYKKEPNIPKTAAWGNFLRVHDELTLEMVSPEVRQLIFENLAPKGADFRNGFGVSGRLANFLDKNPSRIQEAFGILFSIPGIPIIYYGDEVGVTNDFKNAQKSAQKRKSKNKFLKLLSVFDSRDINRGNVPQKLFYGSEKGYYKFNSKIYLITKNLINIRKNNPVLVNGDFEIVKTKSPHNLAYVRKNKDQQILVINNLSKNKLVAEITLPINIVLKNQGKIMHLKNLVNGDDIKVNISTQNRTMHLRLAPYQIVWLEL